MLKSERAAAGVYGCCVDEDWVEVKRNETNEGEVR